MANPPILEEDIEGVNIPYPDRFNSSNFYCGTYDFGGIHHNATVPGKAANLLAMGGSFNGCTIRAIGRAKVEQIWLHALTHHFIQAETFNGAYSDYIQSCYDLYGPVDCDEVVKALQAVEMDQGGACLGLPGRAPYCANSMACTLTSSFRTI